MYVIIIYRVIIVLLCIIVVVVLQICLHFRKVVKESPTWRDFGETFRWTGKRCHSSLEQALGDTAQAACNRV